MTADTENDFQSLLDDADQTANPVNPTPGQTLSGTIVDPDNAQGMLIDLGLKKDGVVPKDRLEKLRAQGAAFEAGQPIQVSVVREDQDGNIIVSVAQPKNKEDWEQAQQLKDSGLMWEGVVVGFNKGGLIVQFGKLQGFVPTSHLAALPRTGEPVDRTRGLANWVGRTLGFKIIEVDAARRRLVLSQREAQKEFQGKLKSKIFSELAEGQVRTGIVTGLRDFGVFVDLGGADGLIHISELSWQHVKHPSELLKVGQTVEVQIVKLDPSTQRIGLSLKRRQTDPWQQAAERFEAGQVVPGTVTRVTTFGAFIDLGDGIDGLLHVSRLGDQPPPAEGEALLVRILNIDPQRQRIGLALASVD